MLRSCTHVHSCIRYVVQMLGCQTLHSCSLQLLHQHCLVDTLTTTQPLRALSVIAVLNGDHSRHCARARDHTYDWSRRGLAATMSGSRGHAGCAPCDCRRIENDHLVIYQGCMLACLERRQGCIMWSHADRLLVEGSVYTTIIVAAGCLGGAAAGVRAHTQHHWPGILLVHHDCQVTANQTSMISLCTAPMLVMLG